MRQFGAAFQHAVKELQTVTESIDEREKVLVKKVELSMSQKQPSMPALPCPALPCPALPCPALPCAVVRDVVCDGCG